MTLSLQAVSSSQALSPTLLPYGSPPRVLLFLFQVTSPSQSVRLPLSTSVAFPFFDRRLPPVFSIIFPLGLTDIVFQREDSPIDHSPICFSSHRPPALRSLVRVSPYPLHL